MNDFQIGEQSYKLTVNECGKIGYNTIDNCWNDWNYQPAIYYPYLTTHITENKVSKSFKIITCLIEKNIIKDITIKEFCEIVNKISSII